MNFFISSAIESKKGRWGKEKSDWVPSFTRNSKGTKRFNVLVELGGALVLVSKLFHGNTKVTEILFGTQNLRERNSTGEIGASRIP